MACTQDGSTQRVNTRGPTSGGSGSSWSLPAKDIDNYYGADTLVRYHQYAVRVQCYGCQK